MATFLLQKCPHCHQDQANGEVTGYVFQPIESLNFAISGCCQQCHQAVVGLGKIAFAHRALLAQAQQTITQHQGPLEDLACIQLIHWTPAFFKACS